MSNWPEITRYSKKSVFLSVPDDPEVFSWAVPVIHRLGGVKGFNEGEKGWILPGNQEENFRAQYGIFRETRATLPIKRVRHSRDPDKKRKRSRVFVRADQNSTHSQSGFSGQKSGPVDLEDKKEKTEEKISSLKPVSYINWEASSSKQDETLSGDEKTNDETDDENRDGSDDESSDDELIQTVLARKMKNESSGKLIDTETINDSDEEDCVSYSRRLRHVYAVIGNLRSRIAELEGKTVKSD